MPNLRQRILKMATDNYSNALTVHRMAMRNNHETVRRGEQVVTLEELEIDITFCAVLAMRARESKTILFPVEQVSVFAGLLKNKQIIALDYNLPFKSVLLEFTEPVEVVGFGGKKRATGFLLEQMEETEQGFNQMVERVRKADRLFQFSDSHIKQIDWSKGEKVTINEMVVCYEDESSSNQISWNSHEPFGFDTGEDWDTDKLTAADRFKKLAIACVGYINCENVYLQREGDVSDAINAKRERKGKSRLEPYYVCRIRGVQYDSAGNPTGEGAKHGIRYDVRGHFRRMTDGKTTWVRPHQRGLANELYIPKTYVVDKKVIA